MRLLQHTYLRLHRISALSRDCDSRFPPIYEGLTDLPSVVIRVFFTSPEGPIWQGSRPESPCLSWPVKVSAAVLMPTAKALEHVGIEGCSRTGECWRKTLHLERKLLRAPV